MSARDVQLSIVEGMERPVGPIPLSVQTGTNADLIAKVAPLYLTGSVLDVTYGEGGWWQRFTPDPFAKHDLHKLDGVDFRALPEADGSVSAVCFDPPYVDSGGIDERHAGITGSFRDRFGLVGALRSADIPALMTEGLAECCRVASDFVLVKCMEFAQGGKFHDIPTMATNHAAACGWKVHDRIVHHSGGGPSGHNIRVVKRARRVHSYLIVFSRSAAFGGLMEAEK